MANYENAKIFTENKKVRKVILKKYEDKNYYFPEIKENMLYIRNRQGQTHRELLKLSLLYEVEIVAQYSFESNRYALTYEVKINNGEYQLLDIKTNYYFDYSDKFKLYVEKENQTEIFNKLTEFYRTTDTVNLYEEEGYDFDLNEDKEITVRLYVNEYEISAVKIGNEIEITHFKYCK